MTCVAFEGELLMPIALICTHELPAESCGKWRISLPGRDNEHQIYDAVMLLRRGRSVLM
jgi:hypothetical protein